MPRGKCGFRAGEEMMRVCPNPGPWNDVFQRLTHFAKANQFAFSAAKRPPTGPA